MLVELVWKSDFTTALNQVSYSQRGNVDYYFMHADKDAVVACQSALAEDASIATLTEGKVETIEIAGGHNSVLGDTSAMSDFISKAFPMFEASWNGWAQTLTVTNPTSEEIELYDLAIDHYYLDGTWGTRQWWSPNWTGEFPIDLQTFSIRLKPNESYDLTTYTRSGDVDIANWDPLWQAQTGIYTVRAKGLTTKRSYDSRVAVEKFSSFGHPAEAQTRSPRGPARSGPRDISRKN